MSREYHFGIIALRQSSICLILHRSLWLCDDPAGCAVPPTAAWPLVAAGARPLASSAAVAPSIISSIGSNPAPPRRRSRRRGGRAALAHRALVWSC